MACGNAWADTLAKAAQPPPYSQFQEEFKQTSKVYRAFSAFLVSIGDECAKQRPPRWEQVEQPLLKHDLYNLGKDYEITWPITRWEPIKDSQIQEVAQHDGGRLCALFSRWLELAKWETDPREPGTSAYCVTFLEMGLAFEAWASTGLPERFVSTINQPQDPSTWARKIRVVKAMLQFAASHQACDWVKDILLDDYLVQSELIFNVWGRTFRGLRRRFECPGMSDAWRLVDEELRKSPKLQLDWHTPVLPWQGNDIDLGGEMKRRQRTWVMVDGRWKWQRPSQGRQGALDIRHAQSEATGKALLEKQDTSHLNSHLRGKIKDPETLFKKLWETGQVTSGTPLCVVPPQLHARHKAQLLEGEADGLRALSAGCHYLRKWKGSEDMQEPRWLCENCSLSRRHFNHQLAYRQACPAVTKGALQFKSHAKK